MSDQVFFDGQTILFWVLAVLTCASAVATMVTQNIVRAATWLLFALGGTAGIFFLLGADLIGAVQLLVYVGGTLILVVFGVMLTAQGPFITMKTSAAEWGLSLAVGIGLYTVIAICAFTGDLATPSLPQVVYENSPKERLVNPLLFDDLDPAVAADLDAGEVPAGLRERLEKQTRGDTATAGEETEDGGGWAVIEADTRQVRSGKATVDVTRWRVQDGPAGPSYLVVRVEGEKTLSAFQVGGAGSAGYTDTLGLALLGKGFGPAHHEGGRSGGAVVRTAYLLPFEIVSVHLLVVLIGAAYLARAKRRRGANAT